MDTTKNVKEIINTQESLVIADGTLSNVDNSFFESLNAEQQMRLAKANSGITKAVEYLNDFLNEFKNQRQDLFLSSLKKHYNKETILTYFDETEYKGFEYWTNTNFSVLLEDFCEYVKNEII